jgi:hypothetical protein
MKPKVLMKFIHLILICLATFFIIKSFFEKLVQDVIYLKDDFTLKIE